MLSVKVREWPSCVDFFYLSTTPAARCPKGIAHFSANLSKTSEVPRVAGQLLHHFLNVGLSADLAVDVAG